jgi:hypothetical protein
MINVGRRKSEWIMCNILLKLQMLFRMKYGYGRMMDVSCRGRGVGKPTSHRHSQNDILLGRRERSYGHNLRNKKCVNTLKLRCDVHMCTFVCMTKHCQPSFNLTEIAPAKSKVKNCCNGVAVRKRTYLHRHWAGSHDPGVDS